MGSVRRGGKLADLVLLAAVVTALGAGCGAPGRQGSEPDGGREHEAPGTERAREGGQTREDGGGRGARAVGVATYNVYLGADLKPLFDAGSRAELVTRAGELYAAMEATDFRERAAALADLLAARAPEVVGLQEVARWERGPAGGELTVRYDFLRLLLDELAARGTPYRAVAANDNFTGRMPVSATEEARFTDRDVIVVRDGPPASRPRTSRAASAAYGAKATLPSRIPGLSFEVPRGWSSVDVTVRGGTFRFATTHLEAFGTPDVRAAQARELAAALAGSPHPVVLTGDFNSRPGDASGAYGILAGAGYADAWTSAGGDPEGGWTAGQSGSLLAGDELSHRIDHVLFEPDGVRAVAADVVGDREADRSAPTGFWPSDHAGVVAELRLGGGR
ncbi:endonuclease/exonuclease/phosphatase family protein [Streptomyces sp. NBC_01808]|uniref:endonuclease/exonuclease/phosphatase family protein n=1 Tax=Streptomyces sp. NBC_01808 TaxID=2975947 RepID=UPI002DD88B8D|nr:endonuclease/exonuclease/phosphatase family protein [Streptomyces sp. NBC_01808]WSA41898.1 endonuclease/exonuclease/phosphatase family protein [Streptomyces sp. NBC_01808]